MEAKNNLKKRIISRRKRNQKKNKRLFTHRTQVCIGNNELTNNSKKEEIRQLYNITRKLSLLTILRASSFLIELDV